MTHPNQAAAQSALTYLLQIQGVYAASVRGVADSFQTPTEIRAWIEKEHPDLPRAAVETLIERHMELEQKTLDKTPSPFPPVDHGHEEIAYYLRAACNMLGPQHDERLDLKVGEIRILAESWRDLIVAIAIPVRDPGVKSLVRGLRRARKKVESGAPSKSDS
jgi:hypothetical protein